MDDPRYIRIRLPYPYSKLYAAEPDAEAWREGGARGWGLPCGSPAAARVRELCWLDEGGRLRALGAIGQQECRQGGGDRLGLGCGLWGGWVGDGCGRGDPHIHSDLWRMEGR